jgi:pimeloyl-ACP methyl ester carboxylesterase
MIRQMYQVQRPSRSEFVPIRSVQYHVRVWGEPAPHKTPLVMVHGWMDVAASFQFMVDALGHDHYIIAPDWRGYGQSKGPAVDNYWFADYLGDLDFLLDHYAPTSPVNLVGHSLGGNVVMHYAGARPERIRRLVNLEGFGMGVASPAQAPSKLAQWMDTLKQLHRGELDLKAYDDAQGVARRLIKTNPRLDLDKAHWLATQWAAPGEDGKWRILGDAAHKVWGGQLYRVEEALALYRAIRCPVLMVEASDDSLHQWWKGSYTLDEFHTRLQQVPQVEIVRIPDTGHMMHHDQPEVLAGLIERFIA